MRFIYVSRCVGGDGDSPYEALNGGDQRRSLVCVTVRD